MNTPYLEQTLRWFGPADPVTLAHIRQSGATGVVSALHHLSAGDVWTIDEIQKRKREIEANGLRWSVVESVPVHEDIKRNCPAAERYLENYVTSLRNLAACGIDCVCYNFMAVKDWTRTDVAWLMPDGSEGLRYETLDLAAFDLLMLKRPNASEDWSSAMIAAAERRFAETSSEKRAAIQRVILMGLPGTSKDLTVAEFRDRLAEYDAISSQTFFDNFVRFLKHVIPVAESLGIRMAIHPDDPPFQIFGLPRLAGDEASLKAIVDTVDSPSNGITFCTGSLGALASNDLPDMLRRLGDRVHFLHLRNVKLEPDGSFFEDDHLAGSTDMAAVMNEAIDLMARRNVSIPMRPDHGRRMMTDLQVVGSYPGYSGIGRLRGLAELRGLEIGLRRGRGI